MSAKQLIEENNRKRKLLTKENETYYDDLLVYIRLQFRLSEQQSEEVLMEMLDHLLEGQEDGKIAKEIFGDNPLSFADEIIEQLPKEDKRNMIPFFGGIILNISSWALMIRGVILLFLMQFIEVNIEISLFLVTILALTIGIFTIFMVWFMIKLLKSSLFKEDRSYKMDMIKCGLVGAAGMAVILVIAKFTPEFGMSFNLNWWKSIILGAILWLLHFTVKQRKL